MSKKIGGKTLAVAFLVILLGLVSVIFWIGLTGKSQHVPRSAPGIAFTVTPTPLSSSGGGAPAPEDGPRASALEHTIHDRRARDEVRQRILDAWSRGDGETAAAAREGRFVPMPQTAQGNVDPSYVREVIRSEYVPLAKSCYDELLSRKKDAGGRIVAKFSIVGDEKIGGIVDDVTIEAEGGLGDEGLRTCLRESLLAVAFRPPPGSGAVTVHYPLTMSPSPDEPDGG